ncbi:MAG TPA: selenide, water dikinase SelD [Candidatus Xenobia bacterium]|jgi:selenide,water dikinase
METKLVRLTQHASCAGCAAKIHAGTLETLLGQLPVISDPRLVVAGGDDAGVVEMPGGTLLVQTLDFFPPIVDDPYLFGQVAAANALSDVYAMGGRPLTAMNIVCFPTKSLGTSVLGQILLGGAEKIAEAECLLVGGHSVEDIEPKYGLSVTGLVERSQLLTRRGARAGQKVYLTKPLGTGVITTAQKRSLVSDAHLMAAVDSMRTLNREACRLALWHHATCATDVTGFGLIGHGWYTGQDSAVTMVLKASALPLLPGVKAYLEKGCMSGGSQANLEHFGPQVGWAPGVETWQQQLIADAQTSGGLLFTTDEAVPDAVEIGRVEPAGSLPLIVEP